MTSPSSLLWEMKNVYKRMLKEAEADDERRLIAFFKGCLYATYVAYEEMINWEVEQENDNR